MKNVYQGNFATNLELPKSSIIIFEIHFKDITRYLSNYAKIVLFKMYKLKRSFFSIIIAILIYQCWRGSETLLKSFGPTNFDMTAHSYDGIMQSEKYKTMFKIMAKKK